MVAIGPFWQYYGGKHRAAPLYDPPRHRMIVEPFAGAAGYSCLHYRHDVLLIDANPDVVATWEWLIGATRDDVMALPPRLEYGQPVADLGLPTGAELLLRWWCNLGTSSPQRSASKWAARDGRGWHPGIRARTAQDVEQIKHWRVMLGTYRDAPDVDARWFIDPPYQGRAGSYYPVGSPAIDYADLAEWCRSRRGDATVCEGPAADWLPFGPIATIQANNSATGGNRSREMVWRNFEPRQGMLL